MRDEAMADSSQCAPGPAPEEALSLQQQALGGIHPHQMMYQPEQHGFAHPQQQQLQHQQFHGSSSDFSNHSNSHFNYAEVNVGAGSMFESTFSNSVNPLSNGSMNDPNLNNGACEPQIMSGLPTHGGQYTRYDIFGTVFEVTSKYIPPIRPIGRGAYGIVCSAINAETNEEVAIKKIANAFDNRIDAKRTVREIKLLRHMDHENVVAIRDVLLPPVTENFQDVYIVYELMDTDLHQIIKSNQMLSEDHCQYFLYQLLRGLKYIHSANVLHRDLKPSNLLLNANCDLKICDFGLARSVEESDYMTEYVVTRWYRAPELLLNSQMYSAGIDVWSVGCIFMELQNRRPLFPGKDYVEQLRLIIQTIGSPSESDFSFLKSETARRFVQSIPSVPKIPLAQMYPNMDPLAVDLMEKILVFDPSKRITVDAALDHPYLGSLHDVNDEPVAESKFAFDFEQNLTEGRLKALIYEEALDIAQHNYRLLQQQMQMADI